MFRSPIRFTDQPLTQNDISQNKRCIELLFQIKKYSQYTVTEKSKNGVFIKEEHNTKTPFNKIPNQQLMRDGNQNQSLKDALANKNNIDPKFLNLPNLQKSIESIANRLQQDKIVIEENVFNDIDKEEQNLQLQLLYKYFRNISTITAFDEDYSNISKMDIPQNTKKYALDNKNSVTTANEKEIQIFYNSIKDNPNHTIAKVSGDGNCFYRSLMVDITYDVLTGKIQDNSETGIRIKNLLSEISSNFLTQIHKSLNLNPNSTLQESFKKLLAHVALKSSNSESPIDLINNADMNLLLDICSPVLRSMMEIATRKESNQEQYFSKISGCLKDEFTYYIIGLFGNELDIPQDTTETYKKEFINGTFSEVYKQPHPILTLWYSIGNSQEFRQAFLQKKNDFNAQLDFLKNVFHKQWELYFYQLTNAYRDLHALNKDIMAGRPEQWALSTELRYNFYLVNNLTCEHNFNDPTSQPFDNNSKALFQKKSDHYNAVLYSRNAEEKRLAEAIQHKMETVHRAYIQEKSSQVVVPREFKFGEDMKFNLTDFKNCFVVIPQNNNVPQRQESSVQPPNVGTTSKLPSTINIPSNIYESFSSNNKGPKTNSNVNNSNVSNNHIKIDNPVKKEAPRARKKLWDTVPLPRSRSQETLPNKNNVVDDPKLNKSSANIKDNNYTKNGSTKKIIHEIHPKNENVTLLEQETMAAYYNNKFKNTSMERYDKLAKKDITRYEDIFKNAEENIKIKMDEEVAKSFQKKEIEDFLTKQESNQKIKNQP